MHNMTDKIVQEKLQVLNDYIQRTIDVLNEVSNNTRQIAQTLGGGINARAPYGVGGLGHTTFGVQPNFGFGQPWMQQQQQQQLPIQALQNLQNLQQLQMLQALQTGLQHAMVPQYGVPQYGVPQYGQQVPGFVPNIPMTSTQAFTGVVPTPFGFAPINAPLSPFGLQHSTSPTQPFVNYPTTQQFTSYPTTQLSPSSLGVNSQFQSNPLFPQMTSPVTFGHSAYVSPQSYVVPQLYPQVQMVPQTQIYPQQQLYPQLVSQLDLNRFGVNSGLSHTTQIPVQNLDVPVIQQPIVPRTV